MWLCGAFTKSVGALGQPHGAQRPRPRYMRCANFSPPRPAPFRSSPFFAARPFSRRSAPVPIFPEPWSRPKRDGHCLCCWARCALRVSIKALDACEHRFHRCQYGRGERRIAYYPQSEHSEHSAQCSSAAEPARAARRALLHRAAISAVHASRRTACRPQRWRSWPRRPKHWQAA